MNKKYKDKCTDCPFNDTECPGGMWCSIKEKEENLSYYKRNLSYYKRKVKETEEEIKKLKNL